jgi:uncharacterized protein (TIGR03437 family)
MTWGLILAAVTISLCSAATPGWVAARYVDSLPGNAVIRGVASGRDGVILVTGVIPSASGITSDAFIARFAASDARQLSCLSLVDSTAGPIVTDSAGSAYITGTTTSAIFPTTPGALQSALDGSATAGFVVKIDAAGKVVYSTLFGQGTNWLYPQAIAVNAAGEAFFTGQWQGVQFPVTQGGLTGEGASATWFMARLSAQGNRAIYAITGVGGSGIAVDSQDNAFVVAGWFDASGLPITENAIQGSAQFELCGSTRAFGFPCSHQAVAKVNAAGSKILFGTFLSGRYGEYGSSIAVDPRGDVYVAGTTRSMDYPVNAGALQTRNAATVPPQPVYHDFFSQGGYYAFPYTGYVTKLAGDGSQILYSTYLGGSVNDSVTRIAVNERGEASVMVRAQSRDLTGLPDLPVRCLPDRSHGVPVVVRLNQEGSAVISSSAVEGVAPGAAVFVSADLSAIAADGPFVARIGEAAAAEPVVCMTDQADYLQTASIVPGQMLTIFGSGLANEPAVYDASAGALPRELAGAIVMVNGVAAPLLYASPEQINFIAPYEIAGQDAVLVEVITPAGDHVRRTLPVAGSSASLITNGRTGYPECQGLTVENSTPAVVLNQDGSINSCENPAESDSVVSVFLTGVGSTPGAITGAIRTAPPLEAEVSDGMGNQVLRAVAVNWAPSGVWQVDVRVKQPYYWVGTKVKASAIQLLVDGATVRESPAAVWLK